MILGILIIKINMFLIRISHSRYIKTSKNQINQIIYMVKEKSMMYEKIGIFQIFPKFIINFKI